MGSYVSGEILLPRTNIKLDVILGGREFAVYMASWEKVEVLEDLGEMMHDKSLVTMLRVRYDNIEVIVPDSAFIRLAS